jgi:hypothetical protein
MQTHRHHKSPNKNYEGHTHRQTDRQTDSKVKAWWMVYRNKMIQSLMLCRYIEHGHVSGSIRGILQSWVFRGLPKPKLRTETDTELFGFLSVPQGSLPMRSTGCLSFATLTVQSSYIRQKRVQLLAASPSEQKFDTNYLHPAAWCTDNGWELYSRDIDYTNWGLRGFLQSFQGNCGESTSIRPQPLPAKLVAIRHLSDIL